ncbi:secretoglobin family 3A member 2 [Myotis daubentonii]|uniref:secretoglobin family 3A member 2 n=1 Tax=Myotis daubentonii TaxID=98922 RepID=UPI002872E222|nr:secretoglobin family 3A member 2 [Myotis daubentonii]
MKLVTVFLLVTVGICSYSATAFLFDKNDLPSPQDALTLLDPLKLLLENMGISVEHLIEGLRKSVNELGPEASEAVKKLLVTTACGVVCHRQGSATLNAYAAPTSPSSHL